MLDRTGRRVYLSLGVVSLVMLLAGWRMGYSDPMESVLWEGLRVETVQVGEFSLQVEGYGTLQSANRRMITAISAAVVDEIRLKAGAKVTPDSVIMTLNNPQLEGDLRQALADLNSAKTQKRQLRLTQQRELLNNESALAEMEAEAEIAQLQTEAEQSLVESGVIAAIHARRNQLQARQLAKRVELERSKRDKLMEVHTESLSIQDDLIAQAQDEFEQVKLQVEQLAVKAGIEGVIQQLPVKLGQSVTPGTQLAMVGSLSPLVAEIKVPQLQAHLVSTGMNVAIASLGKQGEGQVARIDPVITDGAMQVDVLLGEHGGDFKPMQMVDAAIEASLDKNVMYVRTPTGVKPDSVHALFKLSGQDRAIRTPITFGKSSGDQIQILSGVAPGERLITSRLDVDADIEQIKLKR
ncbi:efflux RND transporter periplasmic adaptor subunit [Ferrimonas pelagia]|uniref:HlyD family efflux transporter periplasmic adaptor subunit n=1 Tax=Ferrimonas pelagia TaxID=1177826 RepID=A0ABP9FC88_9GAMM